MTRGLCPRHGVGHPCTCAMGHVQPSRASGARGIVNIDAPFRPGLRDLGLRENLAEYFQQCVPVLNVLHIDVTYIYA